MAILNARLPRPRAGRWWRGLGPVLALAWGVAAGAGIPAPPTAEYQVKAVFLFNFAQFVEWPAPAFANESTPIVIGLLGEDPFGPYLDELVQSEKIGARTLVVRRYAPGEDITGCHILFVSRAAAGQLDKLAASLQPRHVLTVGDTDNFNRLGGMIRFVTERGKIHLRVNMDAAKAAGLTISSKLLRSATIVTGENN